MAGAALQRTSVRSSAAPWRGGGLSVLGQGDRSLIGLTDRTGVAAAVHCDAQHSDRPDLDTADVRCDLGGDPDVDGVRDGDVTYRR
ncbi:MAG: hypothetical protein M3529_06645 [Actinomycetota bacterium]|nr:hypothetical protein [Actinomycetota bacterium]